EADLARSLYDLPPRQAVVGAGIEVPNGHDPDRFRRDYGIDQPFVYYAGRREWGKGWLDLLGAFGELVRTHPTDLLLVTSGVGELDVPTEFADRVIDVGFLADDQRDNAMAAASAYVQPSAMESFSRTVLESWAAGTVVVANADSAVVRWHIEQSGAGLAYRGQAELVEALRFVAEEPAAAASLAVGGRSYVESGFRWPDVLDRMELALNRWLPVGQPARA
ncbi:MAG: glycosyltransferase family 4 protein, partial [Actinomycetia bacterium]|nr:glycosyltransferase family 4 protein [Actinomycetes bacterium]